MKFEPITDENLALFEKESVEDGNSNLRPGNDTYYLRAIGQLIARLRKTEEVADRPLPFPFFTAVSGLYPHTKWEAGSPEEVLDWAAFQEIQPHYAPLCLRVFNRAERISNMVARENDQRIGTDGAATPSSGFYYNETTVSVDSRDSDGDCYTTEFPIELMKLTEDQLEERKVIFEAEVVKKREAKILADKAAQIQRAKETEKAERFQLAVLLKKYPPKGNTP